MIEQAKTGLEGWEDRIALLTSENAWKRYEPAALETDIEDSVRRDLFRPNCEQQANFYNDFTHRHQRLIGGVGSGKSEVAMRKAVNLALVFPGIHGLITRTTGPALMSTTFPHFMAVCPPEAIRKVTHSPFTRVEFHNGSVIDFIAFDRDALEKIKSANLGFIICEEGSMFRQDAWDWFIQRLRQVWCEGFDERGFRVKTALPQQFLIWVTNPAGRNMLWKKFVQEVDETKLSYVIPTYANRENIPEAFIADLEKMPEAYRHRYLEGLDDAMEGLVFPTFDRHIHECRTSWVPPSHWPTYAGGDWGFRTPTSFVWVTVSQCGAIIVYDEYRKTSATVRDNVRGIIGRSALSERRGAQHPCVCAIDSATNQHKGESEEGKSVYEQILTEAGELTGETGKPNFLCGPIFGSKDVWARILRLNSLLACDPKRKIHPITGARREEGWPALIFTSDCPETIKEFENWEWKRNTNADKDNPESPQEKNDHGIDAAGYIICESLEGAGKTPEEKWAEDNSPAAKFQRHFAKVTGETQRGSMNGRTGVM